jgi:hypothetical protein
VPIKVLVSANDRFPNYYARENDGPTIDDSEVMISVDRRVYNRWYRTFIEYEMVQEEIAKKLKDQAEEQTK